MRVGQVLTETRGSIEDRKQARQGTASAVPKRGQKPGALAPEVELRRIQQMLKENEETLWKKWYARFGS